MLDIIYRDEHLVAINKPPGLLVHRSDIDRHETRFAVQLLRDQIGRRVYPAHRLDKGTSGVLLFAFDPEIVRRLGAAFEHGETEKTYLAIVRGWPPEAGLIDHPLSRRHDDYGRSLPGAEAQPARTRYRRLATAELPESIDDRYPTARYALVELQPETGRQHQLRRHMKHLAHPIIGDATYGKGRHNRFFQERFGCARLLLAAIRLRLCHPVAGQMLDLRAAPGSEFAAAMAGLDWQECAVAEYVSGAAAEYKSNERPKNNYLSQRYGL